MIQKIIRRLRSLLQNNEGVTALEYGLIAAATVVAISAFMPGIQNALINIFSSVSTAL